MTNELDTATADETTSGGFSRRTVVRAGAHAAWVVPAVSLATAAPALAASPPPGKDKVKIGEFGANYTNGRGGVHVELSPIANKGKGDAGQITVVVSVPEKQKGPFSKAPTLDGPASKGWAFAGRSGNGPWDFTFVTKTDSFETGEKTRPLDFDLDVVKPTKKKSSGPEVTLTATAYGAKSSDSAETTLKSFK